MDTRMNLDVDAPDRVPDILRRVAMAYSESAEELRSSWQDRRAGWEWDYIAKRLDTLADSIEVRLRRG